MMIEFLRKYKNDIHEFPVKIQNQIYLGNYFQVCRVLIFEKKFNEFLCYFIHSLKFGHFSISQLISLISILIKNIKLLENIPYNSSLNRIYQKLR